MLRLWLVITPILPIVAAPAGIDLLPLALNVLLCVGAAIAFAVSGIFYFRRGVERLELFLGVWIAISPWALAFTWSQIATWNAFACGVVVAGKALLIEVQTRLEGPA